MQGNPALQMELNQGETAFVKMSKQVPNFPDPDRDMMSLNSQRDMEVAGIYSIQ